MAKRIQFRRLFWLALLLGVAFAGLGYRLVELQVVRHEELKAEAEKNTQRELLLEPRRGDIFDIKGNLLATTITVKTIVADPWLLGTNQANVAHALAPILNESERRLTEQLQLRFRRDTTGKIVTNRCVILQRRAPVETWEQVRAAMTNLLSSVDEKKLNKQEAKFVQDLRFKAVYAYDEQQRNYPNKGLAAHVLGFTGSEDVEISGKLVSQISGRDGIELTLDEKLAGVRGWRVTETDEDKRELVPLRDHTIEPRDGLHVVLTIDSVIQHILESELMEAKAQHDPISICGVVVRPRTGEILAMATEPGFDPNRPNEGLSRNRVITDQMEPGSTFKIVVVSAALEENVVRLSDVFDCENGRFYFAGRTLHDHDPFRLLNVEKIITKSSNIGAAKIGIRLGEQKLYEYVRSFGFGARTGIPLQGETAGTVHPVKNWSKVSIAQIPMGHGIAVTPLQMTMAMAAIANKGLLVRPMLVDRLEDRNRGVIAKYAPQNVRRVMSEHTAREMTGALTTVVSPDGTAAKAALDHYTVAGKTGTAQKVENRTYVRKYIASFIGFLPAEEPELCISVVMDEPRHGYYGGQTAAPVFKRIAERVANYLKIRPDLAPPVANVEDALVGTAQNGRVAQPN